MPSCAVQRSARPQHTHFHVQEVTPECGSVAESGCVGVMYGSRVEGARLTLRCLCGNVVANPMRVPATQEDLNLSSNLSVSQPVAASCRAVPKRSTDILTCSVYVYTGVGANFVSRRS